MKKPIDDFIKDHAYINYCEAIIYPDGFAEYAIPSHTEKLINITGEDREVIYKKMPIWESPIHWLIEYTGCVSVWTDFYISPKEITKEQEIVLDKLIKAGLVKKGRS